MANIKIRESDASINETKASGVGSEVDPKIPHFAMEDPATGLTATIRNAEWGEALLGIHSVHAHSRPFFTHMSRETGDNTTVAVKSSPGDYQIVVANTGVILANDYVLISNSTYREPDVTKVISVATNTPVAGQDTLTMARHLDYGYSIGDTVKEVTKSMNVTGTMAAPINFKYTPRPGKVMHLEYLSIYIRSALQPYDSLFGGITAITNGVHVRKYIGSTAEYQSTHIIRQNLRMILQGFDVRYGDRSSPGDAYSTHGIMNYLSLTAGMIRLDSVAGDYYEVMIHDNLTGLSDMEIMVGGHEEI